MRRARWMPSWMLTLGTVSNFTPIFSAVWLSVFPVWSSRLLAS